MGHTLQETWGAIRQRVEADQRFELLSPWMDRLRPVRVSKEGVVLTLNDHTLRPFLTRQHLSLLSQAAVDSVGGAPSVSLLGDGVLPLEYMADSSSRVILPVLHPEQEGWTAPLNKHYIRSSFATGASNRLACAAIDTVCSRPGEAYNPLFIHAGVGLGKTHLLQSVAHRLREERPALRVYYFSCKRYIDSFASSPDVGSIQKLRNFYAGADVLLIDDIHFLGQHVAMQEEFFHLFNSLYNAHKQLILTSSLPPKDMREFREPLLSRFKWGLVVEIEPPTRETRLAIITQKLEQHGLILPDETLQFLAEQVAGNVRELEGAVLKLVGYGSLLQESLSLSTVKQILGEYLPQAGAHKVTIEDIQRATCEAFGIGLPEMLSKKRARSLVFPRHVAMYLVRLMTSSSLEEVGTRFGGRDHSTVKHACEKIQQLMESDATTQFSVNAIKRRLLAGC